MTLFRMGPFATAHGVVSHPPPKSSIYMQEIYKSRETSLEFCWYQHFLTGNQQLLLYQKMHANINSILIPNFYFFNFFLINMVVILMVSAKLATLGLLKIKVFWNKGYHVIIVVHDFSSKIFSRDSNYIVNVLLWPKFCNSSTSIREVIITSIL